MSRNNNEELFLYLEQVLDIRRLKSEGITVKELIKIFNVSDVNIYDIINRKIWKHI